jgi:hypothetical protein
MRVLLAPLNQNQVRLSSSSLKSDMGISDRALFVESLIVIRTWFPKLEGSNTSIVVTMLLWHQHNRLVMVGSCVINHCLVFQDKTQ